MRRRFQYSLSLILVISFIALTIFFFRQHLTEIDHFMMQIGVFGPLFAIFLYMVLTLTPVPTDPLTVIMGALYGPVWGLTISWVGNIAAALLEYFIAHHLGNLARFDTIKHRLPWGLATMPVDSIWFLTLGRLVPGYGSKIVSILAGLYHVPLKKYFWTTALMTIIGSVGFVIFGHYLTRL